MAKNADLSNAKNAKKDEFYTQLEDINAEMVHYKNQFKGKTVLMNCDDPTWSNFWRYFHIEFERLGLKKIIATHYEYGEVASYKMEYEGGNDEDFKVGVKTDLTQNGDFRSPECIELLKEADIVVTNPPFSLFREYIALLMEYGKQFIIWGNNNAITYKDFFPLIRNNKVWLGYMCNKTCIFRVGDGYKYDSKITDSIHDGYKYGKVAAISTFTNIDIDRKHNWIKTPYLYAKKDSLYPEFENYKCVININRVNEIPMDYTGVMAVPITFLGKYNPEQFKIIGSAFGNSWANDTEILKSLGFNPNIKYGGGLGIGVLNGKGTYARLLIKRSYMEKNIPKIDHYIDEYQ